MPVGRILIRFKGFPSPRRGAAGKQLRAALKLTWFDVGRFWHRRIRPKHFTPEGGREYKYTARQGSNRSPGGKGFNRSYTGRKLRQKGHRNPLVWSGQTRALTRIQRITSTSKGVRINLTAAARKLNLRPSGWTVSLGDEMVRVSSKDARMIEDVMNRLLNRRLNENRDAGTIEIRGS